MIKTQNKANEIDMDLKWYSLHSILYLRSVFTQLHDNSIVQNSDKMQKNINANIHELNNTNNSPLYIYPDKFLHNETYKANFYPSQQNFFFNIPTFYESNISSQEYIENQNKQQNSLLPNDLLKINLNDFFSDDINLNESTLHPNFIDTYLNFNDNTDNFPESNISNINCYSNFERNTQTTETDPHLIVLHDLLRSETTYKYASNNTDYAESIFNKNIENIQVNCLEKPTDHIALDSFKILNKTIVQKNNNLDSESLNSSIYLNESDFQLRVQSREILNHKINRYSKMRSKYRLKKILKHKFDLNLPTSIIQKNDQFKPIFNDHTSDTFQKNTTFLCEMEQKPTTFIITEKCEDHLKNDQLSLETESRSEIYINEDITDLLFENMDSYSELTSLLQNFEINFDNFFASDNLHRKCIDEIKNIKDEINLEPPEKKNYRCNLFLENFLLEGYCSFCPKSKCLYSLNDEKFQYDYECVKFMPKNIRNGLNFSRFFYETEKIPKNIKSRDLYSFFVIFNDFQQHLKSIMKDINRRKIFTSTFDKQEIMKHLFHDFISKKTELKILLIPEFYSLLFLMKKLFSRPRFFRNNFSLYSFYFYLRSLEFFIDFISENNDFYLINESKEEIDLDPKKRIYLSLFVRMNLIEPLVLLLAKSRKILRRYRLHYFSLFNIEYKSLRELEYNQIALNFLNLNIHWICYCNLKCVSTELLALFQEQNISKFLYANFSHFNVFAHLIVRLLQLESKILPNSYLRKKKFYYLKNLLIFCKKWCDEDDNLTVYDKQSISNK